VQRTIRQLIGSLWFNIQQVTGAATTLETPTAVAAIRGTQGQQDVPGPDQSTHSLNEGVQVVTERITQQTRTIRAGQRVTAIRGIGFTPVLALVAALREPAIAQSAGAPGATSAPEAVATSAIPSVSASIMSIALPLGTIAAAAGIPALSKTVRAGPATTSRSYGRGAP
jgi:hypothetical protein